MATTMAMVASGLSTTTTTPTPTRGLGFFKPLSSSSSCRHRNSATKILRASSVATDSETNYYLNQNQAANPPKNHNQLLACPICHDLLISNSADPLFSLSVSLTFTFTFIIITFNIIIPFIYFFLCRDATPMSILNCSTCKKTYTGNQTHLDLTLTTTNYTQLNPPSSELFRLPLVSFLYERGWRQAFSIWGGFPGPEKEFEMMKDYLKPAIGGIIIDASCATGLFSRLFAKSGLFSLVVALDFSEAMLKQCYDYIKQEENISQENLVLVRADIARLPFASSSIDAVHAGAALHCWPSPSAGVAEISRILRPGGVFVATTYVVDGPYSFIPFLSPLRQNIGQISGSHIYLSDGELKDLCSTCGLVDYTCVRNRRFVMISARKPN